MKKLLLLLMPNNRKLAGYAAEGIAKTINSQAEREAQIAKIATMADKFTEYQKFVTGILADGKISDEEKAEIAAKLEPVMEYLTGLLK